jgi:hypothetical protein
MRRPTVLLALLALLSGGLPTVRADDAEDEPPISGRPVQFGGAVGSFEVSMRAAPTALQAEDPLVLTIAISGPRGLEHIARPDLRRLPRFAERFRIDNLGERLEPRAGKREFDYQLRPRLASVKSIPPFLFVFYKPGKGYQTKLAPTIPLVVRPRAVVRPSEVQSASPLPLPETVLQIVEGQAVFASPTPITTPGPLALAVLLLTPPALTMGWYLACRRWSPDAVRRARQQRSRGARHALRELHSTERMPPDQQARATERVVLDYLRRRLDFRVEAATPVEVAAHLRWAGCSPEVVHQAQDFFGLCAAARYAPPTRLPAASWPSLASALVHRLEEEPWSAQAS